MQLLGLEEPKDCDTTDQMAIINVLCAVTIYGCSVSQGSESLTLLC